MEIYIHAPSGIPTRDPTFDRAKPVHALRHAATVVGQQYKYE
jgi:hypothetical protein